LDGDGTHERGLDATPRSRRRSCPFRYASSRPLQQNPQQPLDDLLGRHHGEEQRSERSEGDDSDPDDSVPAERHRPHPLHDREAVGEVGQRLDVTAPQQGLVGPSGAPHPPFVELPRVARTKHPVVTPAAALER
jgi:hypothetical protein